MKKKIEKTSVVELKDLPRNERGELIRKFMASGVEYTIKTPSDVLTPARYTEFNRLSMMSGIGLDFNQLIEHLKDLEARVYDVDIKDQTTKTGAILKINAIRNAVLDKSKDRYDLMLMLCTIFIVESNEDLRGFSHEQAIEKIDNWNNEGYKVHDFLSLAVSSIPQFQNVYNEAQKASLNLDISL